MSYGTPGQQFVHNGILPDLELFTRRHLGESAVSLLAIVRLNPRAIETRMGLVVLSTLCTCSSVNTEVNVKAGVADQI